MKYALIENGKVSNLIEWDGETDVGDLQPVAIPAGVAVDIGHGYDGKTFAAPAPAPMPQASADDVRAQRDALLTASDWTQLADVPAATRTAWAPYRQALRDVPTQAGFPGAVTWPKAPSEG